MIIVYALFSRAGLLPSAAAVQAIGILKGLYGAAMLFAVSGHARAVLNRDHTLLRYMRGAIMPVYLFHYLGIVCAMLVVGPRSLSFAPEFIALLLGAFLLPLALYQVLIQRSESLRLLCGLRGRSV